MNSNSEETKRHENAEELRADEQVKSCGEAEPKYKRRKVSSSQSADAEIWNRSGERQPLSSLASPTQQYEPNQTVVFNVGGTKHEVSRSLLEKHENTKLAQMASSALQTHGTIAPIFIERNSARFPYVLDYMRDGRVVLPSSGTNISKDSILMDLEYYGFQNVPSDAVKLQERTIMESVEHIQQVEKLAEKEIADEMEALRKRLKEEQEALSQRHEKELQELLEKQLPEKTEKEHSNKCKSLALFIFRRFTIDEQTSFCVAEETQSLLFGNEAKEKKSERLLASSLNKFGLKLEKFLLYGIQVGKL